MSIYFSFRASCQFSKSVYYYYSQLSLLIQNYTSLPMLQGGSYKGHNGISQWLLSFSLLRDDSCILMTRQSRFIVLLYSCEPENAKAKGSCSTVKSQEKKKKVIREMSCMGFLDNLQTQCRIFLEYFKHFYRSTLFLDHIC